MSSAHHERKHARNAFNSSGVHNRARLKALEALWILDALSCYSRLSLKNSDTRLNKKKIVDQNLEGALACCAPL